MRGKKQRFKNSQTHLLPHRCEEIFSLVCPVKNDEWLPGWREQREIVYSESGWAEPGCVFIVKNQPHLMGLATVVNSIYEPHEKIEYIAVNPHLVYQIQWDLKPVQEGTEILLTRTWTALGEEAEAFLWELSRSETVKTPDLFRYMEHYLAHGGMLRT